MLHVIYEYKFGATSLDKKIMSQIFEGTLLHKSSHGVNTRFGLIVLVMCMCLVMWLGNVTAL